MRPPHVGAQEDRRYGPVDVRPYRPVKSTGLGSLRRYCMPANLVLIQFLHLICPCTAPASASFPRVSADPGWTRTLFLVFTIFRFQASTCVPSPRIRPDLGHDFVQVAFRPISLHASLCAPSFAKLPAPTKQWPAPAHKLPATTKMACANKKDYPNKTHPCVHKQMACVDTHMACLHKWPASTHTKTAPTHTCPAPAQTMPCINTKQALSQQTQRPSANTKSPQPKQP